MRELLAAELTRFESGEGKSAYMVSNEKMWFGARNYDQSKFSDMYASEVWNMRHALENLDRIIEGKK